MASGEGFRTLVLSYGSPRVIRLDASNFAHLSGPKPHVHIVPYPRATSLAHMAHMYISLDVDVYMTASVSFRYDSETV